MRLAVCILLLVVMGCSRPAAGPVGDAEAVEAVHAARAAHGSDRLDGRTVHFTFRGTPFTAWRDGGRFRYSRTTVDDAGRTVVETVDHRGVSRTVNGAETPFASDRERRVAETAVGSVVYFALLPAALADAAVRVRSLGRDTVDGRLYDAVEVTFAQDGGGDDWEDRYLYWLHPERHTVDFLAYTYRETPGDTARAATGHRFRRVTRAWTAGGVRFQDYQNLTADSLARLEDYPATLAAGRLFPVSDVRTETVRVE